MRTRGFEFPPNNAVPLVQFQRKISVALDPLCVILVVVSERQTEVEISLTRIHGGFRRRTDRDGFFEI